MLAYPLLLDDADPLPYGDSVGGLLKFGDVTTEPPPCCDSFVAEVTVVVIISFSI